uniref:Secreted protein n=1 Tax=Xenopus tropicalis TaxID=8364 RepID=A0A1B8XVX6_XENTR
MVVSFLFSSHGLFSLVCLTSCPVTSDAVPRFGLIQKLSKRGLDRTEGRTVGRFSPTFTRTEPEKRISNLAEYHRDL